MKQNTASLSVSDYLLKSLWARCRLVGIINKVYFILVLISILIMALVMTQAIATNCSSCMSYNNFETCYAMCSDYKTNPATAWIHLLCAFIFFIGCLKMVYVNNGLRSTEIPSDGKIVKTWMYYHIAYLAISLIAIIQELSKYLSGNKFGYFGVAVVTVVVQTIEVFVVGKFYKMSNISADHRYRNFQI